MARAGALSDRRNYQPGQVTFEDLMTERNNLFKRHPKTRFIAAHFGWHANDLRAAAMLDAFPNVTVEAGAILYDLGRQPRRRRLLREVSGPHSLRQGRVQPEEFPYYWRVFETRDEYFDYYRDYHAFWKMVRLALPDNVLKKLYYQNALKLIPRVPRAAFPEQGLP